MTPWAILLTLTALGFVFAMLFAALVMWGIIHLQNRETMRNNITRRLQPRN